MSRIASCQATIAITSLLVACVSHEGTYSPACAAFAGDMVALQDGQFVWEKFTDSVVVDDHGVIVNQFPGFPKRGSYHVDGRKVSMLSGSGEQLPDMYLLGTDSRRYLLTEAQSAAWETSGQYADCALILGGKSGP